MEVRAQSKHMLLMLLEIMVKLLEKLFDHILCILLVPSTILMLGF